MSSPESTLPLAGDAAPSFQARNQAGDEISLAQFAGRFVVLYFYPKDNTPGCTIEAREFRDLAGEFAAANAVILGVSPDSEKSHCKFIQRFELNFDLIVDEDHAVASAYGVWGMKSMFGLSFEGVKRTTFLIGPDGKIASNPS